MSGGEIVTISKVAKVFNTPFATRGATPSLRVAATKNSCMICVEITPSPDWETCVIMFRLSRCLSGNPVSCAYIRMFVSRKTLPGMEVVAGPSLTVRVTGVGVHQPEHLTKASLAVAGDSLEQQIANKRIECRLVQ